MDKSGANAGVHIRPNPTQYKHFLKSVSLFNEFSDASLADVLAHSQVRRYQKNDLIFTAGAHADAFRVIVRGWVKLFRETRDGEEVVFSVLTNHEVFGKTAIFHGGLFSYYAEAVTDCEVLSIPATFMLHMAESHDEYDHFFTKFLRAELKENESLELQAEHLTKMNSAQRAGCFLLRMCGPQNEGAVSHQFPYEKALVAKRLGMSPETFSRALNQLSKIGVETERTSVTIHNIEQLRNFVCERCSASCSECGMNRDYGDEG